MADKISNEQIYNDLKELKGDFKDFTKEVRGDFKRVEDKIDTRVENIDGKVWSGLKISLAIVGVGVVFILGYPALYNYVTSDTSIEQAQTGQDDKGQGVDQ